MDLFYKYLDLHVEEVRFCMTTLLEKDQIIQANVSGLQMCYLYLRV